MEQEFSVKLPNKPGEIARLTEKLHEANINIRAISTEAHAEVARLVSADPEKTRETLEKAEMQFSVRNVLVVKLEDKPGELARVTRILANEGINLDAAYMFDKDSKHVHVALAVSDEEKARNVLKL
ncbi:MAG: ACT domain-containing protein [Candidatus Thermoplasmatota archaeon]|nr:ACT domain-containing protein [Candidatus Thermoplasmatota archaeon]